MQILERYQRSDKALVLELEESYLEVKDTSASAGSTSYAHSDQNAHPSMAVASDYRSKRTPFNYVQPGKIREIGRGYKASSAQDIAQSLVCIITTTLTTMPPSMESDQQIATHLFVHHPQKPQPNYTLSLIHVARSRRNALITPR